MSESEQNGMDTQKLLQLLGEFNGETENVKMKLLKNMETFTPTIPESVITHFMNKSGCQTSDIKIKRLIALAAQKFIFDLARDSLRYCQHLKGSGFRKRKNGDESYMLTTRDVCYALRDHGIHVNKPSYFVGSADDLKK